MTSLGSSAYSPYRSRPMKLKLNQIQNQSQSLKIKLKKLAVRPRMCCGLVPDMSLEEWMSKSVTEIVKNIKQAPLLVQVYANGGVEMEKAVEAKNWPDVVRENPEGVILVEELTESQSVNADETERAFGVLVQRKGKGRDSRCRSACYLLKTTRVNRCTHFCLIKVRSFGQSASSQLNQCWLLP